MASGTLRLANLTFPEAIKAVITGKSVTRAEWNNTNIFIFMGEGYLRIQKADKTNHALLVGDGDLLADDWYIVD